MKYNPNEYETVKSRKTKFYKDNPDGRIIVKMKTPKDDLMSYAVFVAVIYKNKEDQQADLPWATGYATEIRDIEKKISNQGKEYESVNYSSWTENCEESAVGRALDNAGYSGNKKCSKEEMEKAKRMNKTIDNLGKCKDCGAPMLMSKKGNPYCSKKCWLKKDKEDEETDKIVNSIPF